MTESPLPMLYLWVNSCCSFDSGLFNQKIEDATSVIKAIALRFLQPLNLLSHCESSLGLKSGIDVHELVLT